MTQIIDNGPNPFVTNIEKDTLNNENYRTTLWTGTHLQSTLMAIAPGDDIGLEAHPNIDQFLRVEQGEAAHVLMAFALVPSSAASAARFLPLAAHQISIRSLSMGPP